MREIVLAAVLLSAGLVGCLSSAPEEGGDGPPAEGEEERFVPPAPEENLTDRLPVWHGDHANPDSHTDHHGLSLAGHTGFEGFYPPTVPASFSDVDVAGGLAAVASIEGPLGATLVDISDPEAPEPVSFVRSGGADWDVRLSSDARYMFVGCQGSSAEPMMALADCTGRQPGSVGAGGFENGDGVVAYGVSDPSEPELAGFLDTDGNHNLDTARIDGERYVVTDAAELIAFDPEAAPGEALEEVATVPGTHDAMVEEHPVTGDWLLYTGAGPGGTFSIYEVNDPSNPSVLVEEGPDVVGWHEQTVSETVIDGRVLLVVGGEDAAKAPSNEDGSTDPSVLTVLNVTDPAEPEVLSEWTIPVSSIPPFTNYRFSPHDVDITPHGQVSVAWYHGGVWVFDVSTQARQSDPVTLGFYQPHEAPQTPPGPDAQGDASIPNVWMAIFDERGYLVAPDLYTGLYVLEPDWGLYNGTAAAS